MSRLISGLVALLLAAPGAGAQIFVGDGPQIDIIAAPPTGAVPRSDQQPPRDGRAAAAGTGRIRGRVVAADSGQPIRKAIIRVVSPDTRTTRTSSTDPDGRYEIKDLPAGRYAVTATKGTYVNLSYGQRRPNEPGKPLQLTDNQTLDKIDFSLARGGVIAGRVLDEFGEPVADVQVVPMRNQFTSTGRRPTPSGRLASTNDIGEFRIYGLSPGQYYVSATLRSQSFGLDAAAEDRSGYAPTYYPGTPNFSDAQAITVAAAETRSDIVLMLVPTRTAQISGSVVDAQGQPVKQGAVQAMQESGMMMLGMSAGPIRPDGSFTVSGVAPGEYTLRAMVGRPADGMPPEVATARVTVNGADIAGVRLAPVAPVTLSGRIVAAASAATTLRPDAFRFVAVPRTPAPMMGPPARPAAVQADLTFQFQASPGDVILRGAALQQGWMIKEIRLNGRDVTEGITVRPGRDVSGLEVEVTDRIPEISGVVTTANGELVHDYVAIFFPQDQELWKIPGEGRTRMVTPDQDGRFKVRSLRPGMYYAAAVDSVETGQWMDPDYLATIQSRAVRLSLGDGETKSVDLKLVTVP